MDGNGGNPTFKGCVFVLSEDVRNVLCSDVLIGFKMVNTCFDGDVYMTNHLCQGEREGEGVV